MRKCSCRGPMAILPLGPTGWLSGYHPLKAVHQMIGVALWMNASYRDEPARSQDMLPLGIGPDPNGALRVEAQALADPPRRAGVDLSEGARWVRSGRSASIVAVWETRQ